MTPAKCVLAARLRGTLNGPNNVWSPDGLCPCLIATMHKDPCKVAVGRGEAR